MHDAALVRGLQPLGDLPRDGQGLCRTDSAFREAVGERGPLDQFQHERLDVAGVFEAVNGSDVRMVQRGQDVRFALEARQTVGVEHEDVRQHLERDLAIERAVVRAIDVAHPAAAERVQNPVVPDLLSDPRHGAIVRPGWAHRCDFPGRRREKISRLVVGRDQPFDLAPQGLVFAALRFEERATFARRAFQCSFIQLLDAPPSFGRHPAGAFLSVSSQNSHARARLHSRFTVRGEMFRTSAVSSTDSPPKNRSSTI